MIIMKNKVRVVVITGTLTGMGQATAEAHVAALVIEAESVRISGGWQCLPLAHRDPPAMKTALASTIIQTPYEIHLFVRNHYDESRRIFSRQPEGAVVLESRHPQRRLERAQILEGNFAGGNISPSLAPKPPRTESLGLHSIHCARVLPIAERKSEFASAVSM